MMHVQSYLQSGKSLEDLEREFAIRVTRSETDPLVILNYSQINSPKRHPLVQECRGLTLELDTWKVVARSFPRFFNAGEAPDLEKKFDFSNFVAESKEDGSLVKLSRYKDRWLVTTRGSFALGEIFPGVGKTWEEVFYEAIDEIGLDDLAALPSADQRTFVFELCSPYNKIVRRYEKPTAFLLTAFINNRDHECHEVFCDHWAELIRAKRPQCYNVATLQQCINWLETQDDPTFEGFVLRDKNGMRIKVKNSRYVALHHLADNGNIFHPKNMLPLVLRGEQEEMLVYFPETASAVFDLIEKVGGALARVNAVWVAAKGIENQKQFAKFVTKHLGIFLGDLLFRARRSGKEPSELFRESADLLLKALFPKTKDGVAA